MLNQRDLEALKEKWWNQNPNKADCPKQFHSASALDDLDDKDLHVIGLNSLPWVLRLA